MSESSGSATAVQPLVEQATRMFQTALEAGIKIQEESTKALTGLVKGVTAAQQWPERTRSAMDRTFSCAKENMDAAIQVVNENTKIGLELLAKALDARQPTTGADLHSRTKEAWETAVGSLRRNTEMLVQVNRRLFESWQEVAKVMCTNGVKKDA
jgi:hypothetical protein